MGCNQSKVICNLPSRSVGFEYMCIVIRVGDLMSVILGTDHEISIIRQAIEETWPGGIQQEAFVMNGLHEFKLQGNPFRSTVLSSPINEISSRNMAGNILHRLYRDGWKLQISSDLTRTVDLTTWIFKKDATAVCPSLPFLMVDLIGVDSLMVFNAPLDLHHMFKDVIEKSWPHGIQQWTYENDVLLIKLNGTPWCADGWATMHARVILQTLVTELLLKQWKLYGNFNLRRGAHTLCFEYDPNVAPGVELSLATHFTVSFNSHDLLRLIGAPEDLVSVVRNTIQTFWQRGIQEEKDYSGSWQFKLHGTPWHVTGDESVDSRYLVLKVLEALQAHGWSVAAAIDCSRKLSDKSSLIFRRSQPRQSQFFCVSLNGSAQLWLINATEDVTKVCDSLIYFAHSNGNYM